MLIPEDLSSQRSVFLYLTATYCIWNLGPSMFPLWDLRDKGNWCEHEIHVAGLAIIILSFYLRCFCLLPASMNLWQVNLFSFRQKKISQTCHKFLKISSKHLLFNIKYVKYWRKYVMNITVQYGKKKKDPLTICY